MPGFFEALMSPGNQGLLNMSAALLQAGGPSSTPVPMGAALGKGMLSGVQGYQEGKKAEMQNLMYQLQANKLKKDLEAQELFKSMFGPQQPAGLSPSSANAVGAPWAVAPQGGASTGPDLNQIGALIALDPARGKAALELWQAMNPDLDFSGGIPKNRRTGLPVTTAPTLPQTNQAGFSTTPRWNPQTGQFEITMTPGGNEAFRTQQEISQGVQAGFTPFLGETDAQGRPIPQTVGQFVNRVSPPAPAPVPAVPGEGWTPAASPADVAGYAANDQQALKMVRDAARMGKTGSYVVDPSKAPPVGMGPTNAERKTGEVIAEGDAKRVLELEQKIPSLYSTLRRLDRMGSLTADERTYAAAGSELKSMLGSISQALGLSVNKDKTANTEEYIAHVAELLKDRLASKDYGSGTGVSNVDLMAAGRPLPEVAKTAQGRQQLIQAIKKDTERALNDAVAARDYFEGNRSLRGFRYPSEAEPAPLPKEPSPGAPANPTPTAEPAKSYPTPPAAAIRRLKMNPKEKELFNAVFGPGAAEKALGR